MWFVYILQCRDKSLYTGITNDVSKRFAQHKNKKGGKYTVSHPVIKIVYHEKVRNRSAALKREYQIKSWTREKKISMIKNKKPG